MKCPVCGSKSLEVLSSNTISRNVKAEEKGLFSKHEAKTFHVKEILCLSCGAVNKAMPPEDLGVYVESKAHFVEKNWSY